MANALEPRRVEDDTGREWSHKSAGMNVANLFKCREQERH